MRKNNPLFMCIINNSLSSLDLNKIRNSFLKNYYYQELSSLSNLIYLDKHLIERLLQDMFTTH